VRRPQHEESNVSGELTTAKAPNNLAIAQDKRQPLDDRVDSIRKVMLANQEKITRGISGMLTAERAIQVACLSVRKNPDLLDCTPASLFGAIAEAAGYGWVCDGVMGQAYLVPFNNRKRKIREVVLIPGYKGVRELIRRTGECDTYMEAIHKEDKFEYHGPFQPPTHRKGPDPQRRYVKPITGAYVLGNWRSGQVKCFYWTAEECMAHRDQYSQTWRRVKDDATKRKDSPWNPENIHEFGVMCCKTVLFDAVHRGEFPLSVEQIQFASRERSMGSGQSTVESGVPAEPLGFEGALGFEGEQDALEGESEPAPEGMDAEAAKRMETLEAELTGCKAILQCQKAATAARDKSKSALELAEIGRLENVRCEEIRANRGERSKKGEK
jgi:phage RecT family recombinase